MTRWRRASTRRQRRSALNGAVSAEEVRGTRREKGRSTVAVDEYDNLILLRSSVRTQPHPEGVAELARFLGGHEGGRSVFTIVVGAEDAGAELWTRFAAVLDSVRDRGVTAIRLVLSGAGAGRSGRPAMAQRIADAWGLEVIAPDASVLIVPGGSLFALSANGSDRGWRSFTSGAGPTRLGPRSPAPRWQPTFTRLPGRTAGGHVVEQVPAGILVRSAKASRMSPGDLCYAVPVDEAHPTVIVDASQPSGEPEVPAEDIAALLAVLPDSTRSEVRLAPCGPADLLAVGQDTAEILGAEVEVLTGLPLLLGTEFEPEVRPVLIGADSKPTWAPFVEAVACRPYAVDGSARAPRLVRWRSPLSGVRRTDPAAVRLSDRWQVCVTRAGLAVGPRGEEPSVTGRPVTADKLVVEVNLRGASADDTLFNELSRLLHEIGTDVREFVTLHRTLPPDHNGDEDFRLLRLAIEHGVSLAEQPPAETAPPPATPNVRTVAIPRAPSSAEPTAAPAVHPPEANEELPVSVPERSTALIPGGPEPDGPAGRVRAAPVAPGSGASNGPGPGRPVTSGNPAAPGSPGQAAERGLGTKDSSPTVPAGPGTPGASTPGAAGSVPGLSSGSAEPSPPTPSRPVVPPAVSGPNDPAGSYAPRAPSTPPGARPRSTTRSFRRSTEEERAEFRALAQPVWDRHNASVNRAMTRMPALRGPQMDAARIDLVAVHLHLSGGLDELGPRDAAGDVPAGYTACLGSGLSRLPSYRGVAVRGGLPDGDLARFVPGGILRGSGPVSALPIGAAAGLPAVVGGYVIWSSTGRRVRPLLDSASGAAADEVVFPPGVVFRVLDVRSAGPAPTVLLVEVAGGASAEDRPGLSDAGRATLDRLDEELRRHGSPAGDGTAVRRATWPPRCEVPLGGEAETV